MISVDTNLIVRFFVRDNEQEFEIADKMIREQEIFIVTSVILETEWVLRRVYKHSNDAVMNAFERLCDLTNVKLSEPDIVKRAIAWSRHGLDFADALHLALSSAAEAFVTFDRQFGKTAQLVSPHVPVRIAS